MKKSLEITELDKLPAQLERVQINNLFNDRDIDFELAPGNLTILYGDNGCGKSTLLRLISKALCPDLEPIGFESFSEMILSFADKTRLQIQLDDGRWVEELANKSAEGWFPTSEVTSPFLDPSFLFYIRRRGIAVVEGKLVGLTSKIQLSLTSTTRLIDNWKNERESAVAKKHKKKNDTSNREIVREIILVGINRLQPITETNANQVRPFASDYIPERSLTGIENVAEHIQQSILHARKQAGRFAEELDLTIFERILDFSKKNILESSKNAPPEFVALLGNTITNISESIQKFHARLTACGLISARLNLPDLTKFNSIFTGDKVSSELIGICSLFLTDLGKKLGYSTKLLLKLELFQKILNSHLAGKDTRTSENQGLEVYLKTNNKQIELKKLSSGEQHLIVLFHSLIFQTTEGGICLIDEPEISLNIDWQDQFIDTLKDVAKLIPLQFIVATHSPQIIARHRTAMRPMRSVKK